MMPYAPDLGARLRDGARCSDGKTTFVLERHAAGDVVFPTGQVVGCDPLVNAGTASSFTVAIPAGTYPLRAWVAVLFRDGVRWDRGNAALQLVVRDEPAVRWELALVRNQDASTLADGQFFGYGVDAGVGTLADLAALRALADWEYDRIDEVFIPFDVAGSKPVIGLVGAITDDQTGANVIIVQSGWGDGVYPTFIGYTAADAVASFVTDFTIIPESAVVVE
jgi:hypothetical protein